MNKKLRILQLANLWRCIPAYLLVFTVKKEIRDIITDELYYWKKCAPRMEKTKFDLFCALILELKEYRSLLYYRLRGGGIFTKNYIEIPFSRNGDFVY